MRRVAFRSLAVLVLGVAGLGAGAAAGGTGAGFIGSYQGFFMNTIGGLTIGNFTATLTGAHENQLDGTATMGTFTVTFHDTFGTSGEFTAVDTGPEGFQAHGLATPFGDGSSRETAEYRFRPGRQKPGKLLFLQSYPPDPGTPQLPSSLFGDFVRDDGQTGVISVRLSQKGSEFQGVGMFGQMPFPFLGTIGAVGPGGGDRPAVAPVHAISVSQFGSINIDGSWVGGPQPHLDGMVTATFADGSVHTATFTLFGGGVTGGD